MILKVKNDLFDYPNRYIMQMESGFKFSLDSILLSEYVVIKKKDKKILDMCTGNAPVPLVLSLKTDAQIVGFEIQEEISKLAIESVEINNVKNIKIVNDDIKNISKYYEKNYFDIITCNPPYFKTKEDGFRNRNDYLTLARHEVSIDLETIFSIVGKYLKDNGVFYLIHRVERLDEIILYANKNRVNVKEIQFISTKKGEVANTVIVKCVKNSKLGVKLRKMVCVDNVSTYQHIFEGSSSK